MLKERKLTREIKIGKTKIGAGNKILLQSMTNTKTKDVEKTIAQINQLEEAGCEIVRFSVPDEESAKAILRIKENVSIPIIADIHFDYKLAIKSIEYGIDGLRVNPGNLGGEEKLKKVILSAKEKNIPIRIGVNMGSLEKELVQKYGKTPKAMVESALGQIKSCEKYDYNNLVVSLKSSDLEKTIQAYEYFSSVSDYPLHIGITETGTFLSGSVKSSVGIGYLLLNGIGDTLRVSLTDNPIKEIEVGKEILKSIGQYEGVEVISCPTCARTNIDIISIANTVQKKVEKINKNIKVAVMGCAVNGPGEASDADIGIAGGIDEALLFVKGEIIGKFSQEVIIDKLMEEIEKI